jgi:archaellum component FlaC
MPLLNEIHKLYPDILGYTLDDDVKLNSQPIVPETKNRSYLNGLQNGASSEKSINKFPVEISSPRNYVNKHSEWDACLDQTDSDGYDKIPQEKRKFLSRDNYNLAVNQISVYTNNKHKAIDLTETFLNNSSNIDELNLAIEKYIEIDDPKETPVHFVKEISEAYDELVGNEKSFISFGAYFVAMYSFVKECYMLKIDAISSLQSIIEDSTNIEDFSSQVRFQEDVTKASNTDCFFDEYGKLETRFRRSFNVRTFEEKIKYILRKKSITYKEACIKIREFVSKSSNIRDLNRFIDDFLRDDSSLNIQHQDSTDHRACLDKPQTSTPNETPIGVFPATMSPHRDGLNTRDYEYVAHLGQDHAVEYYQIPQEKRKFITLDTYNFAVNQISKHTDQSKAINLIQSLIDNSEDLDTFNSAIEKYTSTNTPEKTPEHFISKTSEAYDALTDSKKSFISFGTYFLAMCSLVEESSIPNKYAIHLMQSIIEGATNIEDFYEGVSDQEIRAQNHNQQYLRNTYRQLKAKLPKTIHITFLNEKIKEVAKQKSITFKEACTEIKNFVDESSDINDLDIFTKDEEISIKYSSISAEDLVNSPYISFSKMYNYGQTCWFNALCKHILPFVEKNNDINQLLNIAINNCNTKTIKGKYTKFVLQSLQAIFIDLQDNKPVHTKIGYFFRAVHMYNTKVTETTVNDTQDHAIKSIFTFVADGFNEATPPDYSKIRSHDPEEFYLHLCDLIGISTRSNTIFAVKKREYHITLLDLIQHNILLDQDLLFSTTAEQRDQIAIYQISDNTTTEESETLQNLNALLNRAEDIPKDELISIKKQLSPLKDQLEQIETKVTQTEKFFADVDQLNQLIVRTSVYFYNKETSQQAINVDQTIAVINKIFPDFTMPIIDEKTEDLYNVKFKPASIMMRRGNANTGHYFTISIRSSDNKLFIHNDGLNIPLENTLIENHSYSKEQTSIDFSSLSPKDQLLAYIKQEDVYPVNIIYAVDSKDKQ